jgi:DNA-binding HxlR family transcriptional regulator
MKEGGTVSANGFVSVLRRSEPPKPAESNRTDLDLIERVDQALDVLQGKWKVHLLFFMARGVHRHGRLLACLPGVSKKVMTDTLRALERDGLVARRIFAEVPVRVEYSLTSLGWSMTEPLIALSEWAEEHGREVGAARSRFRAGSAGAGAGVSRVGRQSAA